MKTKSLLLFAFTICFAFTLAPAQDVPEVTRTEDFVAKFVASNKATVENSLIYDNGSNVGVSTTTPIALFDVNGSINASEYTLDEQAFAIGSYSNENAFFGFSGNSTLSGVENTAAGYQALAAVTTGSWNEAIGGGSLGVDNTGHSNAAVGLVSLPTNTSGNFNSALGNHSLQENTTGQYNIGIGYYGGQTLDGSAGTGGGDTGVGAGTAFSTGDLNNATAIGNNAVVGESNALVLGCIAGVNNCVGAVEVGIGTSTPAHHLDMGDGAYEQSGTWTNGSDRNLKENFSPVNRAEVLSKIATMPVSSWNYKLDDKAVRHIGPMAQDFYAAFKLGADDKHISTVDEGGVAIAAVQELYLLVQQKDKEIAALNEASQDKNAQIQELSLKVDQLQQLQQTVQILSTRLTKIENADANVSTLRSSR
jgi:hypothetical protein